MCCALPHEENARLDFARARRNNWDPNCWKLFSLTPMYPVSKTSLEEEQYLDHACVYRLLLFVIVESLRLLTVHRQMAGNWKALFHRFRPWVYVSVLQTEDRDPPPGRMLAGQPSSSMPSPLYYDNLVMASFCTWIYLFCRENPAHSTLSRRARRDFHVPTQQRYNQ